MNALTLGPLLAIPHRPLPEVDRRDVEPEAEWSMKFTRSQWLAIRESMEQERRHLEANDNRLGFQQVRLELLTSIVNDIDSSMEGE